MLSRRSFINKSLKFTALLPILTPQLSSSVLATSKTLRAKSFGLKGDGTDETRKLVRFLSKVKNGYVVDFQGLEISIFGSVKGSQSGNATTINNVPRLFNLQNVRIKNGTFKAIDPKISNIKLNYPTVFSIVSCSNIAIENCSFYGRGENWGNADASARLPHSGRIPYLQVNGGHGLAIIKSKHINVINSTAMLCGSVATFYSASSTNIIFDDCKSNPASLGYAAFCADGWCGPNIDGKSDYYLEFNNCIAKKTKVAGGSEIYCGKAGIVVEDSGMKAVVNNGEFSDMFANGSNKDLGNAFRVGSAELIVDGSKCFNCATVAYATCTMSRDTSLHIKNVVAKNIGLTALITGNESRNRTVNAVFEDCSIQINRSRVWHTAGIRAELATSSFAANLRENSLTNITFRNCILLGADTVGINTVPVMGMLEFIDCDLTVQKHILKSAGWNSTPNEHKVSGLKMSGKVTISDSEDSNALIIIDSPSGMPDYNENDLILDLGAVELIANPSTERKLINISLNNKILNEPKRINGLIKKLK